jgi:hypothetical protein
MRINRGWILLVSVALPLLLCEPNHRSYGSDDTALLAAVECSV